MYGDLKYTFIQKVLGDYFKDLEHTMGSAIRRSAYDTGALLQSLDSRVSGESGELIFNEYGRMLDMGVGRAHPLGGLRSTKVALQASRTIGTALVKDRTRKRKIIYSRIAYGKLNYLENQLLYGFTEETIQGLKKDLKITD